MKCGKGFCTCRQRPIENTKTWRRISNFICARTGRALVARAFITRLNVAAPGDWPNNYRIPDLVLLTPERFDIDHNEYFEGAPDVVVEIHSPGDESYDKPPFYAELGVPEVWIIHRDSKMPELYRLQGAAYERQIADENGWLLSAATGIELRAGQPGKLDMRLAGDETTQEALPED